MRSDMCARQWWWWRFFCDARRKQNEKKNLTNHKTQLTHNNSFIWNAQFAFLALFFTCRLALCSQNEFSVQQIQRERNFHNSRQFLHFMRNLNPHNKFFIMFNILWDVFINDVCNYRIFKAKREFWKTSHHHSSSLLHTTDISAIINNIFHYMTRFVDTIVVFDSFWVR